jgi:hypothetical protein
LFSIDNGAARGEFEQLPSVWRLVGGGCVLRLQSRAALVNSRLDDPAYVLARRDRCRPLDCDVHDGDRMVVRGFACDR